MQEFQKILKIIEKSKLIRDKNKLIDTCERDKIKSYLFYKEDEEISIYTSSFIQKTLGKRNEEIGEDNGRK